MARLMKTMIKLQLKWELTNNMYKGIWNERSGTLNEFFSGTATGNIHIGIIWALKQFVNCRMKWTVFIALWIFIP